MGFEFGVNNIFLLFTRACRRRKTTALFLRWSGIFHLNIHKPFNHVVPFVNKSFFTLLPNKNIWTYPVAANYFYCWVWIVDVSQRIVHLILLSEETKALSTTIAVVHYSWSNHRIHSTCIGWCLITCLDWLSCRSSLQLIDWYVQINIIVVSDLTVSAYITHHVQLTTTHLCISDYLICLLSPIEADGLQIKEIRIHFNFSFIFYETSNILLTLVNYLSLRLKNKVKISASMDNGFLWVQERVYHSSPRFY